jgi:hypothetical protein
MGLKLINQQHSFRKQNTNLPQREKSQAHVHNVTEPMDATTGQPKEQKVSGSRAKTTIKGGEKKFVSGCYELPKGVATGRERRNNKRGRFVAPRANSLAVGRRNSADGAHSTGESAGLSRSLRRSHLDVGTSRRSTARATQKGSCTRHTPFGDLAPSFS